MSFLSKFFKSPAEHRVNMPANADITLIGGYAETYSNILKNSQLNLSIGIDPNKQSAFLLLCPSSLTELKTLLNDIQDYIKSHDSICRIISDNPEIISAIKYTSDIIVPPLTNKTQLFITRLKEDYSSEQWKNETDKKMREYLFLSPLPGALVGLTNETDLLKNHSIEIQENNHSQFKKS